MSYCCCFWIDMYGDEDSDNWKTGRHSLWDMGVEILEAWAVLSLEDLILGCSDLQARSPRLWACTTHVLAQIGQKGVWPCFKSWDALLFICFSLFSDLWLESQNGPRFISKRCFLLSLSALSEISGLLFYIPWSCGCLYPCLAWTSVLGAQITCSSLEPCLQHTLWTASWKLASLQMYGDGELVK